MTKIRDRAGNIIRQVTYNNHDASLTSKGACKNEVTFEYLNCYGESLLTKASRP